MGSVPTAPRRLRHHVRAPTPTRSCHGRTHARGPRHGGCTRAPRRPLERAVRRPAWQKRAVPRHRAPIHDVLTQLSIRILGTISNDMSSTGCAPPRNSFDDHSDVLVLILLRRPRQNSFVLRDLLGNGERHPRMPFLGLRAPSSLNFHSQRCRLAPKRRGWQLHAVARPRRGRGPPPRLSCYRRQGGTTVAVAMPVRSSLVVDNI